MNTTAIVNASALISNIKNSNIAKTILFLACLGFGISSSHAEDVPDAVAAAPNIYSVLAENDDARVILGTWQPGAVDEWHGHPATAVYYMNDCEIRATRGDGTVVEVTRKGGTARVRAKPVAKHLVQNAGTEVCNILMVELK